MIDTPKYIVSRDLPSWCEQESNWNNNYTCVVEESSVKQPLETEEELVSAKAPKTLDSDGTEQALKDLDNLLLLEAGEADSWESDQRASEELIYQLGRDISINCLLCCSRSEYGAIALLNHGFRSLIQSGELYQLRRKMGIVEHWVYFSCNLLEWEVFDPISCRWMRLPLINSNACFMCSDKESLAVGTELLVFGKEIMSPVIYRYSLLTNTWTPGRMMNSPRCLFGSASLDQIAILAGGCDLQGKILSSAELYNSETGTWEVLSSMNKARKMCSGVFMDRKFYVIGGIGEGNRRLTSGEVYDLETRTWYEIPNMFPIRLGLAGENEAIATSEAPPLVAVASDQLYAANYAHKDVMKYDKEKNLWNVIGNLPEQAVSMNGWGLAFRACGDHLMVIGGNRVSGVRTIELNSCVPGEGPLRWSVLARKKSSSFVYNCAVMGC